MNINSEEIGGFLFGIILFGIVTSIWHWIVFRGGHKKWKKDMIQWDKMLGTKTKEDDFFLKPFFLKTITTLMFLLSIFFLYVAAKNLFT